MRSSAVYLGTAAPFRITDLRVLTTGQVTTHGTKEPQAWKFARVYANVVGIAEDAAMAQLFILRPDVKTDGKGHKSRKKTA